jgi:putative mRNA 3-end processing factor
MEGDALEIRLHNGIELTGQTECRFDPTRIKATGLNCVSHAHSDHLPRSFESHRIVATTMTARCASARTRKPLEAETSEHVQILNAGHIPGSSMFLVDGGKKVLYTGDFCPRDRCGVEGARPAKTDVLIIEATYGRPRYVFPPAAEIEAVLRDWVEDALHQGYHVALFAYPLGKSQELITMFSDLEPFVHGSALDETRVVEREWCGRMRYRPFAPEAAGTPSLHITSSFGGSSLGASLRGRMKTATVSGWAIDSNWRRHDGMRESFPMSDHADFEELVAFTKACDPSIVYTHHGFDKELAGHITKRLGIEARPLVRKQRSLGEF